jgi:hypothetical protein
LSDKAARFTKVPPSPLFVTRGKTARFEWDYTYDNRNIEFQPQSLVWGYIDQNNEWAIIAAEKKSQAWTVVINETTCPARLLNPTRVNVESPATLVISNVTQADNGLYGCSLRLESERPIDSKVRLIVTGNDFPISKNNISYHIWYIP